MHIGIVGCGTAGPALAILLARAGRRVTILERAESLGPVGAGILLQPTGIEALGRVGVAEAVGACAAGVERLHAVNCRGRVVLDLRYRDLSREQAWRGWGVQRGLLFTHLLREAAAAGTEIVTGVQVVGVDNPLGKPRAIGADGKRHGPYDLLVFADGARSAGRTALPITSTVRKYPYGAMWFVGEDAEGVFSGTLSQVYRGTGTMLGFLPSGRLEPSARPMVSVFWSVRNVDEPRVRAEGLERFRRTLIGFEPRAEALLGQLAAQEQLVHAAYYDVVTPNPVHGRVVLIGDAAHAMSPQLGLGANLALVDAVTLAESVMTEGRELEASLAEYARLRRGATRFYQFASRWLTPFFQSPQEWLAGPRDLLMGPMCRLPYFRSEMLKSVAGVKTGLFTSRAIPHARHHPHHPHHS